MHIFVPALPLTARDLGTDSTTIQLAISVYIMGLALGQLVYGPLSDAIGRRRAVLAGLSLFVLGGIISGLAQSSAVLIAARLVQAIGGAGGLALTRVIIADTNKGTDATRGIAILNMVLLLGPGLAPVIGAQISAGLGWRAIFAALVLMGGGTIVWTLRRLPETTSPTHDLNPKQAAASFAALLGNRGFMRICIGGAFGSTACYAYFVSAPFILGSEMHLSTSAIGYCMGVTLAAAAAGTLITRSIVGRVKDTTILLTFGSLGLLTGATFLILAALHLLTPISVVILSLLILFSAGGMGPITIGTALWFAGPRAGPAAGVFGSFQMLSGVICSFTAGQFLDHALGCGIVLFSAYLFCLTMFIFHVRNPAE